MTRTNFKVCLLLVGLHVCLAYNHPHHSAQRRFMWRQMDNTVDAMRSMFSDLLPPPSQSSGAQPTAASLTGNVVDYMPSETMRVKYIIRQPSNSKPMKIIKIRATPKKVIKIMAVTKGHSGGHQQQQQQHYHHYHQDQHKYGAEMDTKAKHSSLPSSEELRKLEKEQELKAEAPYNNNKVNDIVSGKITEYNGWSPLYEPEHTETTAASAPEIEPHTISSPTSSSSSSSSSTHPHVYVTVKPYPISKLHTSVIAEPLIQLKDHTDYADVSDEDDPNPFSFGSSKNTYEVVEHTAEESVALPLTHGFHHSHSHSRTGFQPMHKIAPRTSSTTTTTTTSTTTNTPIATTTTEEQPNYPAGYLRKMREREKERERAHPPASSLNTNQRFKHTDNGNWLPISTNSTSSSAIHYPSLRLSKSPTRYSSVPLQKMEKWPPEVTKARPFVSLDANSEALQKKATATFESVETPHEAAAVRTTRKSPKLRANTSSQQDLPKTQAKYRHRGSIKFGDKLNFEELLK